MTSSHVLIRPEAPADAASIEAVTIAAFRQAEHTSHNEQDIVRALRAAGALTVSLVAERDDAVVGHVTISPVSIADGASDWFGLGPISVLPEQQGCGIGASLMRAALDQLRTLGAAGCVVLGDPAYYGRIPGHAAQRGSHLPPGVLRLTFRPILLRTIRQEAAAHLCNNCAIQHLPRAIPSHHIGSRAAP
ncbi:GNAT family N-acetyltransferase [Ralstonia sp. 24A2]|uniref:GNAT family N-acetyltransferase n=1 Tax=Ralstonia sp. 24A2 TaxID=3447364 RepID=UPI003F697338